MLMNNAAYIELTTTLVTRDVFDNAVNKLQEKLIGIAACITAGHTKSEKIFVEELSNLKDGSISFVVVDKTNSTPAEYMLTVPAQHWQQALNSFSS